MAKNKTPSNANDEPRATTDAASTPAPDSTTANYSAAQTLDQTGGEAPPDATAEGQDQGVGLQQAIQAAVAEVAPPAPTPATDGANDYVVGSVPIRHDGRFYGVGADIQLTDGQAERLGGLVAPAPEKKE